MDAGWGVSFLSARRKRGDPPRLHQSVVYFIGADLGTGERAVKIGFSDRDPIQRLRQMQIGCPLELTLLHSMPGTVKLERAIHEALSGHGVRGEWFRIRREGEVCPVREFVEALVAGEEAFTLLRQRWANLMETDERWWVQYRPHLRELVES